MLTERDTELEFFYDLADELQETECDRLAPITATYERVDLYRMLLKLANTEKALAPKG